MTSEVVLMNRHAIALAADSATTIKRWVAGQKDPELRFFKGANKIFNLAANAPIGLMTYNAANLLGVPWEVVVKAFRDEIADQTFNDVTDYAKGLVDFIQSQAHLFPMVHREDYFVTEAMKNAIMFTLPISIDDSFKAAEETDRQAIVAKHFKDQVAAVDKSNLIGDATEDDISHAVSTMHSKVKERVSGEQGLQDILGYFDIDDLAKLAIRALYHKWPSPADDTGLVIAGFGNNDFFPRAVKYRCYGLLINKLLIEVEEDTTISHTDVSRVLPIAQSSMIDTFIWGLSNDSLIEIDSELASAFVSLEKELKDAGLIEPSADLTKFVGEAKKKFSMGMIDRLHKSHQSPLRRVVGLLPIDELAELAETLISIESLKERVTRPTESVGGPIDVAVISRGDGFIWIKRKHYFDPDLNPRYFKFRSASLKGS